MIPYYDDFMKCYLKLVCAILLCELAGIIGAVFTTPSLDTWYATLPKPALNPPSWVFGPVWTMLYLLMGISLFLVWQQRAKNSKKTTPALIIFFTQLLLNTLWSVLFFGLHSPGLALIDIVLLWVAILFTIISFSRISRPAAYLLVPYILWVTFAIYLNAAAWGG